ncbi:MAG: succinylglutamate desuccinylase/aspartoacylase family protein [Bryobacteraceae bacterium]
MRFRASQIPPWAVTLGVLLALGVAGHAADVTVGTATAATGQKATGYIEVPAGVDAATSVPVIVINGAHAGPTLALISGVHGTEYASTVALAQLAARVDPSDLSGTLVILPLLNVASYLQKVVHVNPVDKKGVGGYPGKADGTQSERIAYAVYNQVILKCDHLIDYHGGDLDENLHPYSYWTNTGKPELDKMSREMLFAFGLKTIIIKPLGGRSLDNAALGMGKASITVEAGRAGTTEAADLAVLIDGTLNVMRYLEMLPGAVTTSLKNPLWISRITRVKSDYEGIFYPSVVPEAYVHQGMSVGYITDFFGNKIADVTAPVTGVVTLVCSVPTMKKGDNVVNIGELGEDPGGIASGR